MLIQIGIGDRLGPKIVIGMPGIPKMDEKWVPPPVDGAPRDFDPGYPSRQSFFQVNESSIQGPRV